MRKKRKTLLGITALAFTLCLSMPVMSGTAFAKGVRIMVTGL